MDVELHSKAFGYLIVRSDTEISLRSLPLWQFSYDILQFYWYVPARWGIAFLTSPGKIWMLIFDTKIRQLTIPCLSPTSNINSYSRENAVIYLRSTCLLVYITQQVLC